MPLVVMTVSADRPSYLAQTLSSWLQARDRKRWVFCFVLEPGEHFTECEELIQTWRSISGVSESYISYNPQRRGVADNTYTAFHWGFLLSPFVVLAEEDVLVSTDVLEFFTAVSEQHEDSTALGVCAFSRAGDGLSGEYEARLDFSPLVWGTWRDRWTDVIDPRWHDAIIGPAPGVETGWDWGMRRIMAAVDRPFLAPVQSRSQHIGEHGVHMLPADFPASQSPSFVQQRRPVLYYQRVSDAL